MCIISLNKLLEMQDITKELLEIFFFFGIPQLYLRGSPLLGEIFAYVTVF